VNSSEPQFELKTTGLFFALGFIFGIVALGANPSELGYASLFPFGGALIGFLGGDLPHYSGEVLKRKFRKDKSAGGETSSRPTGQPFTQSSSQTRVPSTRPDLALDEAYNLLGVERTATKLEVRRAYRKLMAQHHPDTLAAKDFSPQAIKTGALKTQKIKAAYELIKRARVW